MRVENLSEDEVPQESHLQANVTQPFAVTKVIEAFVASLTKIAEGEDVKTVQDVTLKYLDDPGHRYWSGDTIGVLSYNTESDVDYVLERLELHSRCEAVCNVGIDPNITKKGVKVPLFVPAVVNYRRLFKECLDLHAVPKKVSKSGIDLTIRLIIMLIYLILAPNPLFNGMHY
uniref:Sulfite reductase [NADPH] flavoprotein alpha-component-like FAD-binding domain-containing protein n=1 Tax=Anopheles maculatus TaxID=74869 RepID=A0A182SZH0_9DIPT